MVTRKYQSRRFVSYIALFSNPEIKPKSWPELNISQIWGNGLISAGDGAEAET